MSDRVVPVDPVEPGHALAVRAADAATGGAAAALTEASAGRTRLGWVFWACIGWVVLNILAAIFAGVLPIQNPDTQTSAINAAPSAAHWFGTDDLGRDIFSRIVYGTRISITVGFGSVAIGLLLGGVPAMIAAFRRGAMDAVSSATAYALLAFPALLAVIAIVTFWGRELWKITLVLGVATAPLIFRIVRASTLSFVSRDFVTAARALGASDRRILVRELLPNILPTVVSFALIGVATVIVLEGSLAFLGLSVPPPTPSWGNMLNESLSGLNNVPGQSNPWLALFPALALFLFVFSVNLAGDRLRQHLDVGPVKL
jgi:peptide/nickel transport system permease protein